jgi:ribosomal protein S18 acetylase RimI-like enzyme
MDVPMSVAIRQTTPAERAELTARGVKIGDHARAYVLGPAGGAIAVVVDRPFESQMLGIVTRHIEDIRCPAGSSAVPSQAIAALLAALKAEEGVRLVSCRRPEQERALLASLQAGGFRFVECLLTLVRPMHGTADASPAGVSVAAAADAEGCAAVAGAAFRYDRFHADPAIGGPKADTLKAAWARNSVLGRADTVFVTRDGAQITGFNACLLRDDTAVIDLIGIAPAHQGGGLGRALTQAALAHYSGRVKRMMVGTQSSNHASLALYQSQGFRIESSAITLHAHLS